MLENIINVTVGLGGCCHLIIGKEKNAIIDAGMAYCGGKQVQKIQMELEKFLSENSDFTENSRKIDYIILSHSHYDHVGAVGFVRETWKDAQIMGAAYAAQVLSKEKAIEMIRELSAKAEELYETEEERSLNERFQGEGHEYYFLDIRHLKVDQIIGEGSCIDLGETTVEVYETLGHTKCSLTFFLPLESTLFPSESTGVLCNYGESKPSILTSYIKAMESLEKCKKIPAKHIISPHAIPVRDEDVKHFWEWAEKGAVLFKDIILECYQKGEGMEEMIQKYTKTFRKGLSVEQQPIEAFNINARASINVVLREFTQEPQ